MKLPIEGFGLAGYRSFGDSPQLIGPCKKVNLVVGQNNAGKSNILGFLTEKYKTAYIATHYGMIEWGFRPLDRHLGSGAGEFSVAFSMALDGPRYRDLITTNEQDNSRRRYGVAESFKAILTNPVITRGTRAAWFPYRATTQGGNLEIPGDFVQDVIRANVLQPEEWRILWRVVTGRDGGDLADWVAELLRLLTPTHDPAPDITLIPAIRRIGEAGTEATDFSGVGIINRLAQLQNPAHNQQDLKHWFEAINVFLREVVGNASATIEVPFNRDMILVHIDNKTLPLSSLGTGTHEVVILAAAATVLRDQVLCIEEPELHLHPLLQRKLIRYLSENTSNQYFITTHSAHLLDLPNTAVFHIRHQHGTSIVEPVYTSAGRAVICADLGYRASDLMQANCVIWVEGPSDRIYLNHWIAAADPELVEGVHYSIMFYGGRLLSHLTADDPEVSEFISLRRLNRYIAILMDSDKTTAQTRINNTKRRIEREFDSGPGFAWITAGREIENYVDTVTLERAIMEIYPNARGLLANGRYDHILGFKDGRGRESTRIDKVKVAHHAARYPANLDVLDLRSRIRRVVQFIRSSNDA